MVNLVWGTIERQKQQAEGRGTVSQSVVHSPSQRVLNKIYQPINHSLSQILI
jgi:hypothetical protein